MIRPVSLVDGLTVFVPPEAPIPEYPKDEENDSILYLQLRKSVKQTEKPKNAA